MSVHFETRVRETGMRLFELMGENPPSVLQREYWTGKMLEWCMADEAFKVAMFRFIDVFPSLRGPAAIIRHLREYFARPGLNTPPVLKLFLKSASPHSIRAGMVAKAINFGIRNVARQFIIGEDLRGTRRELLNLRARGMGFTVDLLGEAVVSEREADEYLGKYEQLLDFLGEAQAAWGTLGTVSGELDWGVSPRINISVKASAMYSRMDACAFGHSVARARDRLRPILRKAVARGAFMTLDMEHRSFKNLTLAIYKGLLEESEFQGYSYTGLAIQAYLRQSEPDIRELLQWARSRKQPITIRLVKGAYWDSEVIAARQENRPVPVFTVKHATDANFEKLARIVLEHSDIAALACASHNIRSIAAVMETARDLDVPPGKLEYQVLFGMGEPVRNALMRAGVPLRVYAPIGSMVPGMSYLVRRLLENTANESFLRQGLRQGVTEKTDILKLLRSPYELLNESTKGGGRYEPGFPEPDSVIDADEDGFRNEPRLDWTLEENRIGFSEALKKVREGLPRRIPLYISGQEISTDEKIRSLNPNAPEEVVALVSSAGIAEAESAIRSAGAAFSAWGDTVPCKRAEYLFRAAESARRMRFDLAALQVLEVGKGWAEADADVVEAIDLLEYYGREMIRLGIPKRIGRVPGEESLLFYEPRGIAVIISPWNFPLAIPVGMAAAAIVTGNTVVLKPASQSPATAHAIAEIFREAHLPAGVLNFLPGPGGKIGDFLVTSPDVALIAFTGSRDVGLHIVELAAKSAPHAHGVKQVIAEMGGKNAIIVDDDADLDEALVHILHSAFSYQGQKCSACSRIIVLNGIYDRFLDRLRQAAESLTFGPSEDPKNAIGAVIESNAQKKILEYVALGKSEGELVIEKAPQGGRGFVVPLAIFAGIRPEHRLAQEEIFGPVVSVIKVRDMNEALKAANSTQYALTGGIFSRSPANIARAHKEFHVGNLYINRGITGAVVGRHPFGGFGMSGVGSKTGGPDYLLQFMVPRNTVENTVRRGFAPEEKTRGDKE